MIKIEIVYASPAQQILLELEVADNSTILYAIKHSNILFKINNKDITLDNLRLGIFGKEKSLNTVVKNRDRIEIYRPLHQDPKELRRLREKNST